MTTDTNSTRFRELDALRGIAAVMVVLFHLTMSREEANLGFKLGTTGVDLFFIISGFVISMSIERVSSGMEFVINRASRLYPTYWACVTFTFLLMSAYALISTNEVPIFQYLANMTMFQYYIGVPDLDDPYWTMIVEMVFYLLMLALFVAGVIKHIVIIGSSLVVLALILFLFPSFMSGAVFELVPVLEFFPLFFAGILFYRLKTGRGNWKLYVLILGCFCSQIVLFPIAGKSAAFINQIEYAATLSVFMICFVLFVNHKLQFLANAPLLFLGKISFALYLIHQYFLLGHLLPLLVNRLHIDFWLAALGICLPSAILTASAITFMIDIPGNRKMRATLNLLLKPRVVQ